MDTKKRKVWFYGKTPKIPYPLQMTLQIIKKKGLQGFIGVEMVKRRLRVTLKMIKRSVYGESGMKRVT